MAIKYRAIGIDWNRNEAITSYFADKEKAIEAGKLYLGIKRIEEIETKEIIFKREI